MEKFVDSHAGQHFVHRRYLLHLHLLVDGVAVVGQIFHSRTPGCCASWFSLSIFFSSLDRLAW